MAEKSIGEIFETMDYDSFVFSPHNRFVDINHVRSLKEKMKRKYIVAPINVYVDGRAPGKKVIQDGQHRYTAERELGVPIRYFIGERLTPEEIASMNNTTKKWTNGDYARTYSGQGNTNYQAYRRFRDKFPKIPHACAMPLLTGSAGRDKNTEKDFRAGNFVVQNETKANMLAEKIMVMNNKTEIATKQGFILALLSISEIEGFDLDRFVHKVCTFPTKVKDYTKKEEFIKSLEEVYNYKEVKEKKFSFIEARN